MKKVSALTLFLTLSIAVAFAANGSGRVDIPTAAKLNGTTLEAGSYRINWVASDSDKVQVTLKSGDTSVTATGKLVENPAKADRNYIIKSADGTLKAVYFGGKTTSISFGD